MLRRARETRPARIQGASTAVPLTTAASRAAVSAPRSPPPSRSTSRAAAPTCSRRRSPWGPPRPRRTTTHSERPIPPAGGAGTEEPSELCCRRRSPPSPGPEARRRLGPGIRSTRLGRGPSSYRCQWGWRCSGSSPVRPDLPRDTPAQRAVRPASGAKPAPSEGRSCPERSPKSGTHPGRRSGIRSGRPCCSNRQQSGSISTGTTSCCNRSAEDGVRPPSPSVAATTPCSAIGPRL
mmetsp:Transcript_32790/g.75292  ORF Transcript_32790/g.75292 Transcript_32790/m.75292 type:complete len:236 (-) Transcript_32790:139-846(-)